MSQDPVADPQRTAALVVGVEKYREAGWDLKGVAADARAFARWLIGRGVPADRVLLHLSEETPAGPLQATVGGKAVEVDVLDANYATVRKSFRETVEAWGTTGGLDLLVVFWAGHGYVDDDLRRWLDCADSRHQDRLAFSFDSLLAVVRCPPYPALTAAFVDACAIDLGLLEPEVKPGGERLQRGTPNPNARQFVLFSARISQFAENRRGNDPDSFTVALFKALGIPRRIRGQRRSCPPRHARGWPPDLPGITDRVKAHFRALRTEGKTDQVPVFANVAWDGDVTDSGLFRLLAASRDASRAGPPPDPGHIADLAAAVASLDFLADERNRAALLRELPPPFSLGLSSANNSLAFSRGLAWNALSDHPDLDPLLDALDRFDEIHADPILDARVFPALDRLRRQPISWSEVARLRRLLTETERPGGAGLIDPGAFDVVVLNFLRNNRGLSEIPSDALLRPGAFAARLATLPVTQASAPPLLHFVREVESLVPDPLRSQLKDWVDGVAVRLGVEAPSPAPAGVTAKAERAADESTRLVICLEPYLYKSDHFAVNAWLVRWGRDVKVACDHAEITREAVIDMINKRLRKLRDNEPREVELFLPVEMLAEGVARWEVTVVGTQKVGIDARFPVKLRCLDRLPPVDPAAEDEDDDSPFDEVARQLWKDRWGKRPGAGKPLKDFCIPLGGCP